MEIMFALSRIVAEEIACPPDRPLDCGRRGGSFFNPLPRELKKLMHSNHLHQAVYVRLV